MKKIVLFSAVAAVAMAASPAQAATNLVQNGGFETVTRSSGVTGNFEFGNTAGAKGQITGWTSASTSAYNLLFNAATANTSAGNAAGTYQGTGNEYMWASTASTMGGGNFVALDGDVNVRGALTQTLNNLTVGQSYLLTFEWGAGQLRSRTGATTEQLQYSFGNQSFTTDVISNPSMGFSGWNTVSRTFTATSTSQVLSFLSIGTPTGLPPIALLDNVSVAAVPEPATWAMMLVGFGMVGAASRYRRRKTSVAIA